MVLFRHIFDKKSKFGASDGKIGESNANNFGKIGESNANNFEVLRVIKFCKMFKEIIFESSQLSTHLPVREYE